MPGIKKPNRKVCEYLIFPLLALICAVAYYLTLVYHPYEISEPALNDDISVCENDEDTEAPLITETRCARLSSGKIGIYDCYGNLEYTIDAETDFLPRADKLALTEGIIFDNESQLCEFIESLDS